MVVMFKMTPDKKEKWIKKLDKMLDFIEEVKECFEESEDEDVDFRENTMYHQDWDEEEEGYVKVPKSKFRKMAKMARRGGSSK